MSFGSNSRLVARTGTSRSTWGRSHTTQQRPSTTWCVIATSVRVRPHSGWRGSTTVMVGSGDTLCSIGVVIWLGFANARLAAEQDHLPLSRPGLLPALLQE